MKEACARHQDSSPLLHRVHGTISVKIASLLDDPNAKLRHLRSAIESARRAVSLSPNSVEFAHFYANLMYEAAAADPNGRGYEEVVQECERALSIPDPIDPGKESLQDDAQQKSSTPEARIAHVHQELRALIQKSNIASISNWMKNLGNGGNSGGEEKFRLIPMRRLSSSNEDPMEVRLVQAPRRPNEIKKATKTEEDRRKEIEVRVAAARILQQRKSESPNEDSLSTTSQGAQQQRSAERRKLMNSKKLSERMEQVKAYWNSLSVEKRLGFMAVNVVDVRAHYSCSKDGMAAYDVLSEAFGFVEGNEGSWEFWVCCRCNEKFRDSDSHMQHMVQEHMGSLQAKLQTVLPQQVEGEWVELLLNDTIWKPIDVFSAAKMLGHDEETHEQCQLVEGAIIDKDSEGKDCVSEYWSSKDNSDSSSSLSTQLGESNGSISNSNGNGCNGFATECKGADLPDSCISFLDVDDNPRRWPVADDPERSKLLERIQGMFQLLVKHKSLSVGHLNKVIQFAMDEIQSPACICFLGASQLRKVLKFLQELSQSCGLNRYSSGDKDSAASTVVCDANGADSGSHRCDFLLNGVGLSYDPPSSLLIDGPVFHGKKNDIDEGVPDTDAVISWLFAGPSSGDELISWTRMREEKSHQGLEILRMLDKEFGAVQSMCEKKCEHLSYEEALQTVENLCVEEFKKREKQDEKPAVHQSYEALLRKRQEELLERDNEVMMFDSTRFELEALSNLLKEAQTLNVSQFGYDEAVSGVTSRLCELECGDEDVWRVHDFVQQGDTCIEIAIQRQKEQLSVELNKIDAKIMKNVNNMQQLELKLGPTSALDYRSIVLPLVKSFLRLHLEELVDKDAAEKSEAAREAFLAELALAEKKNISKGGDSKQSHEKLKDRKKSKDNRKTKDIKVVGSSEQIAFHQKPLEQSVF
ncbi:uncharacterized protein A4U43_UnF2660 [Asparagus officinalis]|uniref:C2H2-type domain-containing protein n=1 Tax=Asparagus officinalis TaxID=4686 RepID=A0A1R3L775_ASPOF|nr:uncharacterized protein A4U43_UnF2660 [Asparagus officinalis]